MVDQLAVSQYFAVAEQLGCARIQMELDLVDRLLELQADTASGEDFLEDVVSEVQAPTP